MIIGNNAEVPESLKWLLRPVNLLHGAIAAAILVVLYFISLRNYLLFHSIVELAGIAVAISIFIIVWNTRWKISDPFFLIVGISFLFIGSIDLFHTLTYKGMGVFPGNNSDLPTQFWIAARYFQSITFLIATLFIGRSITKDRKYDAGIIIAACSAACALLYASIFVWQNFPQCFIDGSGLTPFKIASEYLISLILIATIIILYYKQEHFDPAVWKFLIAAQVFLILGELAFTSYISVYGFMNMLGHLFRLVSVYLFYRAFVVIGLTRPYDLLLRELRKEDESLQMSETKFREIFNSANDAIHLHEMRDDGLPGKFIDVNMVACRMLQYSKEELLEMSPLDLTTTYHSYPLDQIGEELKTKGSALFETEHRRKDGGIVPVEVNAHIIVIQGRKMVLSIIRDLTRRKRDEAAFRRLSADHRAIIEHAPAMIWYKDTKNNFIRVNPAAARAFGMPVENIEGKSSYDLFPDLAEKYYQDDLEVINSGKPKLGIIEPMITAGGEHLWVQTDKIPLMNEQGTVTGILLFTVDITGRKQMEDSLVLVSKKLNLLSSITRHDIRNQLMALNAYIALSEDVIDKPDELKTFFAKEQKIADAISRQLDFTKDYEELGVKSPVWQNVSALIRSTGSTLPTGNIRLDIGCPGLEVFADPLLEKVFYNLIDNSLHYGGEKMTAIRVTAGEQGADLRIMVTDDGNGISADDKKQLFTKGFGKHTGLGLFLSREILSITGITITENGEPGKGARFEITVPNGAYRFTDQ